MNISKIFITGTLCALAFTSCSDDDDNLPIDDDMPMDNSGLFATSHSDGNVTRYNLSTGESEVFTTNASDAEGIFYSPDDDGSFTIAVRGDGQNSIESYEDVNDGDDFELDITGPDVLDSARDLAVSGDYYVVADNANPQGRFFVFERGDDSFVLRNTITVDFEVWGIEFVGSDLYAVVDNTSDLAVFNNFLDTNADATLEASKRVTIEGIVRTHGLDYDGNTMIMTDIAAASGDNFDTDGAFHVITDFDSKLANVENGGTLSVSEQIRYEGNSTLLGNPVNVVYDSNSDIVYIAELANGGGRVLSFESVSSNTGGNVTPSINNELAGVSSLYLHIE